MRLNIIIFIFALFLPCLLIANKIEFTPKEKEYLKNNAITYAGDPNWLPFEAFDKNGSYTGIIANFRVR